MNSSLSAGYWLRRTPQSSRMAQNGEAAESTRVVADLSATETLQ
jgi:hypothetical protein